jgi:hypothetical protein
MKKDVFMGTLAAIFAFVAFTASLVTVAAVGRYLVTHPNAVTWTEILGCALAVFFGLAGCLLVFMVWIYIQSVEGHSNAASKH